ncbi:MAG: hypothetical protein ABL888_15045 [Pirellulaceae bacterium]
MQDKTSENCSPSRRSALVTGAVVAAGLVWTRPLLAGDDLSQEIQTWEALKGQFFTVTGPSSARSPGRKRLKLAGVEYRSGRDSNLPEEFREPFVLIFVRTQPGALAQGEYTVNCPNGQQLTLFMNETLAQKYSSQPVMQAVFS